jgi:tetratricopeptide (TPR) repeat protein
MPTTTYMQVDARHDHSIRVPRPDQSLQRGTPNACSNCHRKEGLRWVADAAQRWYPQLTQRPTPLADALYAQEKGLPQARGLLQSVAGNAELPAMARASALARLAGPWTVEETQLLQAATHDPEGLVRGAVVDVLQAAPMAQRLALLAPLLSDPLRTVRMAVARALADVPPHQWDAATGVRQAQALSDYVRGQQSNADRPEALNNLALLYATQGDLATAQQALQQALDAAPDFVATRLNLADVLRAQRQDAAALKVLEDAARVQPASAAVWYALGLARHRAGQRIAAMNALELACRHAPGEWQYAYALALAQDAVGRPKDAIATLRRSLKDHGGQRSTLEALVGLTGKTGDLQVQQSYRQRLGTLAQ